MLSKTFDDNGIDIQGLREQIIGMQLHFDLPVILQLTIRAANAVRLYKDQAKQYQDHYYDTINTYVPLSEAFNISIAAVRPDGLQATLTYLGTRFHPGEDLVSGDIEHGPRVGNALIAIRALGSLFYATAHMMEGSQS